MTHRCAIVTGGAMSIGLAIAQRLRADGFRVFVLDLLPPEDTTLRADAKLVDLADVEATTRVVGEITAQVPVTVLVANVGIVAPARLEDVKLADFDRLMHVNLRSALVAAQAVLPAMRRSGGGRIVMTTSRVTKGKEERSLYSASKGAMQSMARTWALELAADGITVNCVAPGPIATSAFWRNNPSDASATRAIVDSVPVGRIGEPEDVANAVSFFCDSRSSFVTGQTLFVCGGVSVG